MTSTKLTQLSASLSSRYGLPALSCANWRELALFGGIGMDPQTFNALASAAALRGDTEATIYELESLNVEFPPAPIHLDFDSFNQLKSNTACLFEVAMLPRTLGWIALLTDEMKTFVYGPQDFLSDVSQHVPEGMK